MEPRILRYPGLSYFRLPGTRRRGLFCASRKSERFFCRAREPFCGFVVILSWFISSEANHGAPVTSVTGAYLYLR